VKTMNAVVERELPADVQALLTDPAFAQQVPPLGNGAKQLLGLPSSDRDDPRVLALLAQKDPIHLARLLSWANSVLHQHPGTTVSTAEGAVRRIGVQAAYAVLLASAMAASFSDQSDLRVQRRYLLNYTVSLCLTAKKVTNWLRLSEDNAGVLTLGSLLSSVGLFAGMLAGGSVGNRFSKCLAEFKGADLRQQIALTGFLQLSCQVAESWDAPTSVLSALADSGAPEPATADGKLLCTIENLVQAKRVRQDQVLVIRTLKGTDYWPSHADNVTALDLGVSMV
jgi:HD-like signal output (HDOD) protein